MKEQIIQLEPHDDVVSVRDRLGWVRAQRVLLVWPQVEHNGILQRELDLILIHRELTRRDAQFALITDDPLVIDHAHRLDIPTFDSVEESRTLHWRTPPARLGVLREERPHPLDPEFAGASRRRIAPSEQGTRRNLALVAFGLAVFALLVVAFVVLPGATVTLIPASNQVSVSSPITADPELAAIDFDGLSIPARIIGVEVEDTAAVETTGISDQPSSRATGIVTFINQTPEEVTVPVGTVVRTTAGNPVRFATTAPVVVPDSVNATADAPVEALEPGVEANLPPNLINSVEGPLSSRMRVTNASATRGGDILQVPAVSQEDYDRLRSALLQQLQQRAYAEMDDLMTETEFVAPESLLVVLVEDETYDRFVGEEAPTVSLEMRVVVQGVAIDERNARQVTLNELVRKVGAGFQVSDSSLVFRRGDVTQIDAERRVTFLMQGSGDAAIDIDEASVQRLVRGRTVTQAAVLLEQQFPLRQPPTIQVRPPLFGRLPVLPQRIRVESAPPA